MRDRPGRPKVMAGTGFIVVSPDQRVLIVKQEHQGVTDWGFNGGGLEAGETIEQCAVRECFEELGLRVRLVRLLRISQMMQEGTLQGVGFVFLCTPDPWPQEVALGTEDVTRFIEHRWVSREEYEELSKAPGYDFWDLPWPPSIMEPELRVES